MLASFKADGTLDGEFGEGGVARTDAGGCVFCGGDLALQDDGKIVVPGAAFRFPLFFTASVARFNADGSVDTGFGSGGVADSSLFGLGERLALQADGKILVAAQGFSITRFDSTGALDETWGAGGTVPALQSADGQSVTVSDIAAQPDGNVLALGYAPQSTEGLPPKVLVFRLTPTGAPDEDFGDGGVAEIDTFGVPNSLTLQPDGILVAGETGGRMALLRLGADGARRGLRRRRRGHADGPRPGPGGHGPAGRPDRGGRRRRRVLGPRRNRLRRRHPDTGWPARSRLRRRRYDRDQPRRRQRRRVRGRGWACSRTEGSSSAVSPRCRRGATRAWSWTAT